MKHWRTSLPFAGALFAGALCALSIAPVSLAAAQDGLEEVIVWGRAESQTGTARSASEGVVGYADFSTRPLARVGELVEVVPGMVATQHSGEGKANQYFLRGMNLDHGTDFSAFFEGMPVNLRTHAHGQGYLDLNFLIPEIIATVRYEKGPYAADRGDFSTAGTTAFTLYDNLRPFAELTTGSDGYRRGLIAGSSGNWLGALEATRNDGPWVTPADVKKTNAILKHAGTFRGLTTRLVLSLYDNTWNSTDQVPRRVVDAGVLPRFGSVDPTLGGDSSRSALIVSASGDAVEAGYYASRYTLDLHGNFTYFAENPLDGDQHQQRDRRWIHGGWANGSYALSDHTTLRVGADARLDNIADANLYHTTARVRRTTVRDDAVEWLSLGAWGEVALDLPGRTRLTAGLRHDHYRWDVDARLPQNSGTGNDSRWTPSLAFAWLATDALELYANWGSGFHSNDVRGATISTDPVSGDPIAAIDVFVDQQGAELGARYEQGGLVLTLATFWLESDSELLFVGDSGATEPSDGSSRTGTELSLFWSADRWSADLSASRVDSTFDGVPSGLDAIPNAHGRVINGGVTYTNNERVVSLRARHFGDAPLTEDGSVRHSATTIFSLGGSTHWRGWTLGLEVHNLFDAEDYDIAYLFESRLNTEPAPVQDIHFHPVLPRNFRITLRREL